METVSARNFQYWSWPHDMGQFLEQIAPSPATHARKCCEDFCGCRAGEMASEIHEIFYAFGPQLNTFMLELHITPL